MASLVLMKETGIRGEPDATGWEKGLPSCLRVQGGNLEGQGSVLCLKTRWLEYPERGGIPIWTELPS